MKTINEQFDERFNIEKQINKTSLGKYKRDIVEWVNSWSRYRDIEIKQFYNEKIKEIIALSDKIETESPSTTTEEWIAFKHFRNTLRDKYENNI